MAGKKASKGKRYTDDEKQRILGFVHQVNQEKGRGGLTAAAMKFGVSSLTVGAWLKASGKPGTGTERLLQKRRAAETESWINWRTSTVRSP
jgi:transposase-like protein